MAYIVRIYKLDENCQFNDVETKEYPGLSNKVYYPLLSILNNYFNDENDNIGATIVLRVSPELIIDSILHRMPNAINAFFADKTKLDIQEKDVFNQEDTITSLNNLDDSSFLLYICYSLNEHNFKTMLCRLLGADGTHEQIQLILDHDPSLLQNNINTFFQRSPFIEKPYTKKIALIISTANCDEIKDIITRLSYPRVNFVEIIYTDYCPDKNVDELEKNINIYITDVLDVLDNIMPRLPKIHNFEDLKQMAYISIKDYIDKKTKTYTDADPASKKNLIEIVNKGIEEKEVELNVFLEEKYRDILRTMNRNKESLDRELD